MDEAPGFGAVLARLLSHRDLSVSFLAGRMGVPESRLQSVLDGGVPDGSLIWRLAPELGLHAADLFVIAGLPVPGDLAPVDVGIGRLLASFVLAAMELPPESRAQVLDFLRSLPQQDRTQSAPAVRDEVYERFLPGLGRVLVLMLRNRNLDWLPATELIYQANGPVLSGSMIGSVGLGRREVTPRLLAAFATVLGIPIGDLAAIGGLEYRFSADPADLDGGDMAALIWEARRLTAEQVRRARGQIPPRRLWGLLERTLTKYELAFPRFLEVSQFHLASDGVRRGPVKVRCVTQLSAAHSDRGRAVMVWTLGMVPPGMEAEVQLMDYAARSLIESPDASLFPIEPIVPAGDRGLAGNML